MLQAFGIHWVMPRLVAGLLFCWHQWLGKHNSNIWNLIPGCLMWIVWLERNRRSFEDIEKTLDELKVLHQRSLFEWSRCWGFTDYSSLSEFMFSLRLVSWFPSILLFVLSFSCSSAWTSCTLPYFFPLLIVLWLPIQKKGWSKKTTKIWGYVPLASIPLLTSKIQIMKQLFSVGK